MKTFFFYQAIAAALIFQAPGALAQKAAAPATATAVSTPDSATPSDPASSKIPAAAKEPATIYRQIMPDGRVVYSDKPLQGTKVDNTITLDPPIKGNLWSTQPGPRPLIAPQVNYTPVIKVATPPLPSRKKMLEEATSEVIRAEMLLEDAKRRQQTGGDPLPAERSGDGNRLNAAYQSRQQYLASDVIYAESVLKKAITERDALR